MNLTDTNKVTYTPGHSPNATDFMSRRGLDSHGAFFLPHLQSGKSVLDCGCGPGTITMDIALRAGPAEVIGIDFASSQVDVAKASAAQRGITNVRFVSGDVYALPFDSDLFDRVFSHALMEHLANPLAAMRELYRVVKPGGVVGVCSPDWNGFLLSPPTDSLVQAVRAYSDLQTQNGGDPNVGSKLGELLGKAGFRDCRMEARYEIYPNREDIGNYLALQLEHAGDSKSSATLRGWSTRAGGMFAQSWVSCVAAKPGGATNE